MENLLIERSSTSPARKREKVETPSTLTERPSPQSTEKATGLDRSTGDGGSHDGSTQLESLTCSASSNVSLSISNNESSSLLFSDGESVEFKNSFSSESPQPSLAPANEQLGATDASLVPPDQPSAGSIGGGLAVSEPIIVTPAKEEQRQPPSKLQDPAALHGVEDPSTAEFIEFTYGGPATSFSRDEVDNVKHTADWLLVRGHLSNAYRLYMLLLQRYRSGPSYCEISYWHLLVQSVKATEPSHSAEELVQILRSELLRYDPLDESGRVYLFTVNMHLFMIRGYSITDQCRYVYFSDAKHLISQQSYPSPICPPGVEDRAFVLAFFHSLVIVLGHWDASLDLYLSDPSYAIHNPALTRSLRTTLGVLEHNFGVKLRRNMGDEHMELREFMTRHIPGPFEFSDHRRKNSLSSIRSCMEWCGLQIQLIEKNIVPETWRMPNVDSTGSDFNTRTVGELFSVFCHRWTTSHLTRLWMRETESMTGITPFELLLMVCWRIQVASCSYRGSSLLVDLERGADMFRLYSKRDVAFAVLEEYFSRSPFLSASMLPVWWLGPSPKNWSPVTFEGDTVRIRLPVHPPIPHLCSTLLRHPAARLSPPPGSDLPLPPHMPPTVINGLNTCLVESPTSSSSSFNSFVKAKRDADRRPGTPRSTHWGYSRGNLSSVSSLRPYGEMSELSDRFSLLDMLYARDCD